VVTSPTNRQPIANPSNPQLPGRRPPLGQTVLNTFGNSSCISQLAARTFVELLQVIVELISLNLTSPFYEMKLFAGSFSV
jgi:hypothetical protein